MFGGSTDIFLSLRKTDFICNAGEVGDAEDTFQLSKKKIGFPSLGISAIIKSIGMMACTYHISSKNLYFLFYMFALFVNSYHFPLTKAKV